MSFDRLAPHYRWMEWVLAGEKLQRCRVIWLDDVKSAKHALLVGEGHGRFLAECARRFPETRFTCVDASREMLNCAQSVWRKARGNPRQIEFVHAALPDWSPPQNAFDLIVTDFFLDCFSPRKLPDVIAKLSAAACPGAHWLIADFCVPARGWLRIRAQIILSLAYSFFRVATNLSASRLTAPDDLLRQHGFQLTKRRISEWGLLHADQWQLMKPIEN